MALDGPDSLGLGLRQSYTVTEVRGGKKTNLGTGTMFAVPSNVGPRTMPDYEGLAAKGIYPLTNGGRVFAGQRDETFYIDLGSAFDTLNFRCTPLPCTPILTSEQDANDNTNPFGVDHFSGFNVNGIAISTTFPTTGRTDLVDALLKYPAQTPSGVCTKTDPCSELLRLNLGVTPTLPADQKRLGGLASDAAGFPNGRRPNDDVTDIVLRVAAGALLGPVPNLGDGVNFNIGAPGAGMSDGLGNYGSGGMLDVTTNGIAGEFPFLPTPHDGRNRRHIDCGETGGNPCN